MNKCSLIVGSLNFFLMQNIKMKQLCFPGIFFPQDLVFPRHHLTFGKKQDYHWVASDSWLNL